MFNYVGILLFLFGAKSAFGANVLYVAAVPSPSHHIWNRALAIGLVQKGYNVTHIGPDQDKLPKPENYTHILLEGLYDKLHESIDINEMASYSALKIMGEFENWSVFQCHFSLRTEGLQKLLNYPPDFKFDLIIFDITAGTCFYPLIHRFNYPPSVAVTAFLLPMFASNGLGNHLYPSYIPWYGFPYTTEMNFIERVWNFVYSHLDITLRYTRQYVREHEEVKKIFGENIPRMDEFERHISLLLANTDPILDYPHPVPPNIIPVGGLHTRKSKNLPQDLQNLLDNAKNGVIVFSLGTNVRSDKLDQPVQKALLEAFSKLPETVIWKFESEIENLPKNVIVRKWLPQNDILGHPNVKLFIGHGGALSTQEAIFHGVPMVSVPFIVDQHINTKIIVKKQLGVYLNFKQITADYVLKIVKEALDNPVYHKNMKRVSKLFKDRQETPLERGIFWLEYVIRNGGAEFLSPSGRNLPFYKLYGLDVIIFLFAIISVGVIALCRLCKIVLRFFGKKKVKVQ